MQGPPASRRHYGSQVFNQVNQFRAKRDQVDQSMSRFRTLADVEAHLALHTDYEKMARFAYHERSFNLDRTRFLLAALGNPQDRFQAVHVAGTKGKGSVSHMVSAALTAGGFRTGLFTSPHLVSLAERVRLDDRPIGEEALCRGMERVAEAAEGLPAGRWEPPTFFERMFALSAFLHAEAGVEWGVYEVGLGGRLDATNVLSPRVCAITTLGLDHTQILGETLPEIAREKAGIVKPRTPCVAARAAPEALAEIFTAAERAGAPLLLVGRDIRVEARPRSDGGFGIEADVDAPGWAAKGLRIPLAGLHQGENAAVAAGVLGVLRRELGVPLTEGALRAGLETVRVPGRLQRVLGDPTTVIDVAHNEVSMKATMEAVRDFFPHRELHVALGISADKDIRKVLAPVCERAARLILTTSGSARSAPPGDLAAAARALGFREPEPEPDLGRALDALRSGCRPGGLALVTGSFYVAGKAYRHWGIDPDAPPDPDHPAFV